MHDEELDSTDLTGINCATLLLAQDAPNLVLCCILDTAPSTKAKLMLLSWTIHLTPLYLSVP